MTQSMVKFWAGCSILNALEGGETDKSSLLTKAEKTLVYQCNLLEEEILIPPGCIEEVFHYLRELEIISVDGEKVALSNMLKEELAGEKRCS